MLLTDEETKGFIYRASECLAETSSLPTEYNAEEFVTFSKKILEGLLKAQLKKVVGRLGKYKGHYDFHRHVDGSYIVLLMPSKDWQSLLREIK